MNKENKNKSAAGLRRSAIAERIRLREEWSELKGAESKTNPKEKTNILTKKQLNVKTAANVMGAPAMSNHHSTRSKNLSIDILRGVVALVDVGTECRALPLRAALTALGASVLPTWSPLVTHLVWTHTGDRATRARARALACRLVSPLWVEACAAASRRLPEQAFPAAARASDLPSPRTLRRLLKKAELENLSLSDLLSDSNDEQKLRLRLSSDTSANITTDTSRDTSKDTSHDTSKDTSHDTSKDTSRDQTKDSSADIESRVNTAPRRALPNTSECVSPRPARTRRKLFTHREENITKRNDDDSDETTNPKPRKPSLPTKTKQPTKATHLKHKDRREQARAERATKKLLAAFTQTNTQTAQAYRPRIVLTGMSRTERRTFCSAIRSLGGRAHSSVDRRTTHVILGSCIREDNADITGITNLSPSHPPHKPRTLNALLGAARGARVLTAHWLMNCHDKQKWLHHTGYEVPHLKKISQKARVERLALGKLNSEYAYDVFNGMRVCVCPHAELRDAVTLLLRVCGADIVPHTGGIQRTPHKISVQLKMAPQHKMADEANMAD